MKEGAFLETSGPKLEGGCNYEGQEGKIEVLKFNHWLLRPTDINDVTRATGERQHGHVTILKDVDKSSPLLIKALCEGQLIESIKIEWYRQPKEGSTDAEHAYTHEFKKCMVTSIRPQMEGGTGGGSGHAWQEVVEFGYQQGTWTYEDGGIEFTDEVRK